MHSYYTLRPKKRKFRVVKLWNWIKFENLGNYYNISRLYVFSLTLTFKLQQDGMGFFRNVSYRKLLMQTFNLFYSLMTSHFSKFYFIRQSIYNLRIFNTFDINLLVVYHYYNSNIILNKMNTWSREGTLRHHTEILIIHFISIIKINRKILFCSLSHLKRKSRKHRIKNIIEV